MAIPAMAQWTSHPSFSSVGGIHTYDGGTLCVCPNAVFVCDSDGEITAITKTSGLSSAYVSAGGAGGRSFAVGYEDGSLDLFAAGRKHFIDDVTLGNPLSLRRIHCITFSNATMLVGGDFGVAFVDAARADVLAVCRFHSPVLGCALHQGRAYVSLGDSGVRSISLSSLNLQDPELWSDDVFPFPPDAAVYLGPRPQSVPSDAANSMSSADGTIVLASRYCTAISKKNVSYFENPDGVEFTAVFHNPYNPAHVFLGDESGTLYEYIDQRPKSAHRGKVSGKIISMDCTPEGDLFILSDNISNPVAVFDHNGNWHSASSFRSMNCASPRQILYTADGVMLVNMGSQGIFAVDLMNTPLDFSDDIHNSFYPKNGSQKIGNAVTAMQLDGDGRLLIGTSKGIAYCSDSQSLMQAAPKIIQPVISEPMGSHDYYTNYVLGTKHITGIEVDAAGRKWISTMDAGVYLISADFDDEVLHFTEKNSPLPSDTVYAINMVQKTGEIFFSTRNGLASYLSDVQAQSDDLSNVVVYPNPVRPGYGGSISISGLEDGSDVRITDVSGHLVYKCESMGGRVEWDCRNLNGRRCASGVYMIFVFNAETGHKIVKKLLIVN